MKFQFVEQIRNKQQQLGEPYDFTHSSAGIMSRQSKTEARTD